MKNYFPSRDIQIQLYSFSILFKFVYTNYNYYYLFTLLLLAYYNICIIKKLSIYLSIIINNNKQYILQMKNVSNNPKQ